MSVFVYNMRYFNFVNMHFSIIMADHYIIKRKEKKKKRIRKTETLMGVPCNWRLFIYFFICLSIYLLMHTTSHDCSTVFIYIVFDTLLSELCTGWTQSKNKHTCCLTQVRRYIYKVDTVLDLQYSFFLYQMVENFMTWIGWSM